MSALQAIRAMVEKRRVLAEELAAIDVELGEIRAMFSVPKPLETLECPVCHQSFTMTNPNQKICLTCRDAHGTKSVNDILRVPPPAKLSTVCTCKGCGIEFTPSPGSAGVYCSRACYQNPERPNRTSKRPPSLPSPDVPPLRSKDVEVSVSASLPEQRCINHRCLKKFRPRDRKQIYCVECEQKPKPTSWQQQARPKPTEEFDVVFDGRKGQELSSNALGSSLGGDRRK